MLNAQNQLAKDTHGGSRANVTNNATGSVTNNVANNTTSNVANSATNNVMKEGVLLC